jgi:adenylate kinase
MHTGGEDKMMKIVLVGPPGSGKSTVGKIIANECGLSYISSGDISRSLNTPIGRMADESAMRRQIKSAIDNHSPNGFVLDGFPRTIEQAILLSHWVGKCDIFCLVVNSDVSISRLSDRGRADDSIDIILHRLNDYYTDTHRIVELALRGFLNYNIIVRHASTSESMAKSIVNLCNVYGGI